MVLRITYPEGTTATVCSPETCGNQVKVAAPLLSEVKEISVNGAMLPVFVIVPAGCRYCSSKAVEAVSPLIDTSTGCTCARGVLTPDGKVNVIDI